MSSWIEATPQGLRDLAFDNLAAAPDGPVLLARLAKASAVIRAQFPATMDLPYGSAPRARIDLLPGRVDMPCLVYFHGGYWQMNSREMFTALAEGVRAHGWSAAFVGYTLAPEASLTAIVREIGVAIDWLNERSAASGVHGPLVAAGSSAGGLLAALALEHQVVIGGMAMSGIFELAPLRDTFLNVKLKLTDEEISDLSPIRRPVVAKPFALAIGSAELPAVAANTYAFHALRRFGGRCDPLVEVPGANHFSILEELRDPQSALVHELLAVSNKVETTP
ncbi:alpha/beta hydrolase [Hyphomicrobium sp.]|uniref:alpha/beta hydrolase n=1 Tax=Hyphomicrobium sp. TaxID=82 RepID=UPI002FDF9AC8